jgi:bifunctional DNA-binding transcriptional regulator/antitoxin component of YhaV-PrlF toxin-antitoxin module
MTDKTSLTKAASNTTSLRTTVPASIVKQFNLKETDELEWILIAESEGKMGIKVIPLKREL